MTLDFSQMLNPAASRDAMLASSRRLLDYQKQLVGWQLDQARAGLAQAATVEGQVKDLVETTMAHGIDASQRAFEQALAFEDVLLTGLTGSTDASAEADTAA